MEIHSIVGVTEGMEEGSMLAIRGLDVKDTVLSKTEGIMIINKRVIQFK